MDVSTQHPALTLSTDTQHPTQHRHSAPNTAPTLSTQHAAPNTQHPTRNTQHRYATPTLSTQHSAPTRSTQHSAPNTQHRHATLTLSNQHSAPTRSTQHTAPNTQHPTHSTQHSAPNTQHPTLSTQHATPTRNTGTQQPALSTNSLQVCLCCIALRGSESLFTPSDMPTCTALNQPPKRQAEVTPTQGDSNRRKGYTTTQNVVKNGKVTPHRVK